MHRIWTLRCEMLLRRLLLLLIHGLWGATLAMIIRGLHHALRHVGTHR